MWTSYRHLAEVATQAPEIRRSRKQGGQGSSNRSSGQPALHTLRLGVTQAQSATPRIQAFPDVPTAPLSIIKEVCSLRRRPLPRRWSRLQHLHEQIVHTA